MISDMSAIHRIDDMYSMGSRRWAQLVMRLVAYPGAVQFRMKVDAHQETAPPPEAPEVRTPIPAQTGGGGVGQRCTAPPSPMKGGEMVEATRAALTHSDIGDMFSWGTG